MKYLFLTPLFFFVICTFAFAQDNCRLQDSLTLVKFHRFVDFKTEFEWDLETPMNTWNGVTLSQEGCVERLELSGMLEGTGNPHYVRFNTMSQLTHVDLSDNNLNSLPDMEEADQLTYVDVSNNQITFIYLWSHLDLPNDDVELVYIPQGIIGDTTEHQAFPDIDYTIKLPHANISDNEVKWYKDGTLIATTQLNTLDLNGVQASDAGTYTATVTNPRFPDLTLQIAPQILNMGGVRERDSLSLTRFYEDCEFKLEAQRWDLSQPIDTWYGVTLSSEGCVERLELQGALSEGSFYYQTRMRDLACLTHLDLRDNNITSINGAVRIPNLDYFNIQNNALTMYDLLVFAEEQAPDFIYHPQNPLPASPDTIIEKAGNNTHMVAEEFNHGEPGNIYTWYQNGTEVADFVDYIAFSLTDLQPDDSGTYICELTNPALPDLTLYTEPVEVLVMPSGRALDSLILTLFEQTVTFKPGHGWDTTQPINTWEGVTLNADGRVKELLLPNLLTQGVFIQRMEQLDDLEVIDLSHNNLTGSFIGSLPTNNPLPFSKLKYADISHNQLTGSINIHSLLDSLEYLDCSNNKILNINGMSTAGLKYLDVSNNTFASDRWNPHYTDLIPQNAGIEVLRLNDNDLVGNYIDDYHDLEQLRVVELQHNKIAELLPDFFNPSVDSLNVTYNQLTFEDLIRPNTPNSYSYAPQDSIEGALFISTTPGSDYTIYLDFDKDVENNIYTWYKDGNFLTTTTEGVLPLTNLQTTDSGNYDCQITNPALPELMLNIATITLVVDELNNNCRLRDSLALIQIGAAEINGERVHWDFSKPLEEWYGVQLSEEGCVVGLGFNDDRLEYIPEAIGQLLDVETIYIKENRVSGTIPRSVRNLTKLRVFSVTEEWINGPIPIELTTLTNLEILRIEGDFTELPPGIGNLTNLSELELSGNLTTLPEEIYNLTRLERVSLRYNQLSSLPPNLAENWTWLYDLDLYYNYLTYDDLLQFKDFNFGYQNTIGTPDTIELTVGDDFIIDLEFDENVPDNTYHWFRNSIPIDTTTQNQLVLDNVQLDDVGIYTCQVYNETLWNYVLNTAPITLVIEGIAPESPVYPGDANADGIVSGADVLFWGLANGNTGEIRPDASVVWTPQPTPDWDNAIGGINGKHQDTDGSGLVDEADLDIIEVNYQKTNINYQHQFYQGDALQISPQIAQAQNFAGTSEYEIEISVGNNAQGTTPIHGLSFTLDLSNLNSAESYTAELTNTNSWLAPSNVVSVHDDYVRRSDFALTRSDLQNKTGLGALGTLNVISNDLPTADTPQFRAVIRNITAIQSDGTLLRGEDVFIGSFRSGSGEGIIPALEFEAIAYAATCEEPSSATVTITSGTPPYEYQWGNGDTTATAENLPPGEHQVIVTDDFGQSLTAMVIVPNGTPLPDVELQTNTDGAIELISNIPDIQYEWNGLSGASTTSLTPGQHTLTVSNAVGCSKTISVWVADIYSNVILEGAYDATSGLMNDQLRQLNLIPLTDPYTGRMTTTDAVLQVTGNAAIVDWVLLELHDKDIPGKVIASYPALLRRDGFIISNDGINPPRIAVTEETDHYLVVKHRNHLPVRSGTTVSLANEVTGQTFEQGNASLQKQMNDGIYAAFAGDISTDHTIDGADKIIWEVMNGSFNQYHAGDTNLDGDINGADKGVWFSNNGTFTDIE